MKTIKHINPAAVNPTIMKMRDDYYGAIIFTNEQLSTFYRTDIMDTLFIQFVNSSMLKDGYAMISLDPDNTRIAVLKIDDDLVKCMSGMSKGMKHIKSNAFEAYLTRFYGRPLEELK